MSIYPDINRRIFRHRRMLIGSVVLYFIGLMLIGRGMRGYGAATFGAGVIVYAYALVYSRKTARMKPS